MRLGIISDTNGKLRPELLAVFAEADQTLHGGDLGPAELLDQLAELAPVTAVYGNVDGLEVRKRCPKVARGELDGFIVIVTHGDQFGSPTPEVLHREFPDAEIIVYGHTHRPLLELVDKTVTVMNPGSAGGGRGGGGGDGGRFEGGGRVPPRARAGRRAGAA